MPLIASRAAPVSSRRRRMVVAFAESTDAGRRCASAGGAVIAAASVRTISTCLGAVIDGSFGVWGESSRRHAVAAGHRRGGEPHDHDEGGLYETDPREPARGAALNLQAATRRRNDAHETRRPHRVLIGTH